MTNRIAFGLALVVLVLIALDLVLGLGASMFLARKFVGLLDWLSFWN